jgi:hypothetical protein
MFWVKILKFFDADPDPGSEIRNLFDSGFGIRDPGWEKFGSWTNIPDPQHCVNKTCWIALELYT